MFIMQFACDMLCHLPQRDAISAREALCLVISGIAIDFARSSDCHACLLIGVEDCRRSRRWKFGRAWVGGMVPFAVAS